ncbi:MAG TPA: Wzz/FepE/Etk N-terminal domain-containing protein [Bacteroidia bacterium]|nr:Wzz/FepE/Etk N-terminal domain-containing protein [Bacteroidia bacterium]
MLSEAEQKTDTERFWKFITKNFKTLLLYAILGGVAATVVTFFLPKEYKSYGIVYPPSSTSIDNSIDFPNFGYDVEADRLMQILQSEEIMNKVMNKFDLVAYYEIDKSDSDWLDQFMKKYARNIKFERTPSMSVLISVRTKDAVLSSRIVSFIIQSADEFREKIYKKNIIPAYENAKLDYETQKHKVDSVQVQLTETFKRENMSSLLLLASDAQLSLDIDKLATIKISGSNQLGAEILAFKSMYEVLKDYKTRFIKVKKTYMNPIPRLYVINYGEPNHKKVSPSFMINISIGILFSLFVTVVVLLIRHNSESR